LHKGWLTLRTGEKEQEKHWYEQSDLLQFQFISYSIPPDGQYMHQAVKKTGSFANEFEMNQ
jgi:hypothetical protein